jgi:hypothetical protein
MMPIQPSSLADLAPCTAAEQMQGERKPVFDKDGALGKQFQRTALNNQTLARADKLSADGNIGKIGEAVGGPFSSQGAVGDPYVEYRSSQCAK